VLTELPNHPAANMYAEDVDGETPVSFRTESEGEILSATSPLQDQMHNFYREIVTYKKGNPTQPLELFYKHEKEISTISGVVLDVAAITPSFAEVERTNKLTNLSSAHIYKLVTLDCWVSRGEEILRTFSDAHSGNAKVNSSLSM
jgi:DNA replicative helicase MCM subunit Mcm2 (Cdc46/Mcm family)